MTTPVKDLSRSVDNIKYCKISTTSSSGTHVSPAALYLLCADICCRHSVPLLTECYNAVIVLYPTSLVLFPLIHDMSGFEIAGVVLGALPLVITALEHYGEGIKTIKSMIGYQALVGNLILDLKIETRSFQRGCENLLGRLQIPPEEAEELLKFPKGRKWSDPGLHAKIRNLLGHQDYAIYEQLVLRLFARLDAFSKKLQLDDNFLPRWMKGSNTRKSNAFTKFLRKTHTARRTFEAIMLGLQSGDYGLAIADIRSDVEKIGSLVGDAMELAAPRRERGRRLNTKFWSSIRQYAESLFQSIKWQCLCAPNHTVHLQLQTREKTAQGAETRHGFVILFAFSGSLTTDSSLPWIWRQAQVRPSEIPQAQVAGSVSLLALDQLLRRPLGQKLLHYAKHSRMRLINLAALAFLTTKSAVTTYFAVAKKRQER